MRYYIVDLTIGEVSGCEDEETARDFAESDEYVVIDTTKNEMLMQGTTIGRPIACTADNNASAA